MEAFVSVFSTKSEMCLNLSAAPTERYDVRAAEPASTTGIFVVSLVAASAAEKKWFLITITCFLYFHTSSI